MTGLRSIFKHIRRISPCNTLLFNLLCDVENLKMEHVSLYYSVTNSTNLSNLWKFLVLYPPKWYKCLQFFSSVYLSILGILIYRRIWWETTNFWNHIYLRDKFRVGNTVVLWLLYPFSNFLLSVIRTMCALITYVTFYTWIK